jgi:peroxidase
MAKPVLTAKSAVPPALVRPIGNAGNSASGLPGAVERRLQPAHFASGTTDGIVEGPNARTISNVVASGPHATDPDPVNSSWLYVFGQFVDHDLDRTAPIASRPLQVNVPNGDPDLPNGTVIPLGGRETDANGNVTNAVASYLDLSQVYGSDTTTAASLRNADGTLKTSTGNAPPIVNGQFVSGDVRVAENPELAATTALFIREHNFQVAQLAKASPKLTGDQLYDAARSITTAEYQNVVYNEYLPALLGPGAVPAYGGFNANVSPQVSVEFSTAVFRVGHSQVSGELEGIDNNGNTTFTEGLAQSFFQPPQTTVQNGINELLRGRSADPSQVTDVYAVNELRNLLAAPPDAIDLIAIDIERERDVGLGSLNQTRAALGLSTYTSFNQITNDPETLTRLQAAFPTVNDVDLFTGGLAETHVNGGAVGQTFNKIISQQFADIRTGDKFYWQNQGFETTLSQQIAGTRLSDILIRDTDTPALQANVFHTAQRHLANVPAENPNGSQLVIGVEGVAAHGGPGDDTIFAAKGLQSLSGGGGSDVFVFSDIVGNKIDDTITDFDPANDKLDLNGLINPSDMVQVRAEAGGSVLKLGASNIHLQGVAPGSLTTADFVDTVKLNVIGNA